MNMNGSYCGDEQRLILIDALLLAYRCGQLKSDEELAAMLASMRAANDAMTFLQALENFGVGRRSKLFSFVSKVLSAPAFYRAQYPIVLGLRQEGEAAEPFLRNQRVLFLVEALLTNKQRLLFSESYWWFVHNHEDSYYDPKKGWLMGIYATAQQDNASTLERFEEFLLRLQNHTNKRICERYESVPVDFILAVLKRAFL